MADAMATEDMTRLVTQMSRSRGDSGIVVFVKHRMVPGAQPRRGRPFGTTEEAREAALEMLNTPHFIQAWLVSKNGIQEVTR